MIRYINLDMSLLSTKDRILKAAVQLLEESGIKAVTQPAVAKLVGIPQGQLTYHFPKRADLVLALTDKALDGIAEFLWKKMPDLAEKSVEGAQKQLISLIWNCVVTSKPRVRALIGLLIEADENPEVKVKLTIQEDKVRALIASAMGVEPDSQEVTLTHATLLGFGLLSFLHSERNTELEKDFIFAIDTLRKSLDKAAAAPKSRAKTAKRTKS